MTSDPNDLASELEEAHRQLAIAAVRAAPAEPPDEDEDGVRYCLDCGAIIPPARIQLVQAVRCVPCVQLRELRQKQGVQTRKMR